MGAYAVVRYTSEHTTESKRLMQEQILDMKKGGMSFPAIGRALGVSQKYAYKLYEEAINAIITPGVEGLRKLEGERMDAMLIPVMGKILEARNAALAGEKYETPTDEIALALKISERRSKLFGLDAPTKLIPPGLGGPLELQNLNLAQMSTEELMTFRVLLAKAMPAEEEDGAG